MDTNDQGLPQDGTPLEPSQQNLEGNDPGPSQEDTGQLTNQQLQDMLPEQDERGVPAENVLGEMRRKMDKMMEELTTLKSSQTSQQFQPQQQYQQPQQQVPQPIKASMPKSPSEAVRVIDAEVKEKFNMSDPNFNPMEMLAYREQRMFELSEQMMNERLKSVETNNVIRAERDKSFGRISNSYPDLANIQSPLSQAVLNEVGRRAYMRGIPTQQYLEQEPYAIESATQFVAPQLGISPKVQNKPKIVQRQQNLPPSNFQGKQTVSPKDEIKPTQEDIALAQRFGGKPETYAKVRENHKNDTDPRSFDLDSNHLLS